jgi:hypothetical protein
MNYFLVPGKNHTIYNKINTEDGYPLGENKHVVDFMTLKAEEHFGEAFKDFLSIALVEDDYLDKIRKRYIVNSIINAEYSSAPIVTKSKFTCSTDTAFEIAADYLKNGVSMRDLERKHLNEQKPRGNKAMKILNSLGISGSQKGSLINSNIDTEINKATGILKDTLIKIKDKRL